MKKTKKSRGKAFGFYIINYYSRKVLRLNLLNDCWFSDDHGAI